MSSYQAVPTAPSQGPSLLNGVVIGFFTALLGAVVWAVVVAVTHYQIGFVAVALGLLVGLAMARNASANPVLPVIAGAFALLGCVVGDLLCDIVEQANFEQVPLGEALTVTFSHPAMLGEIFSAYFSPLSLLFWAIAASAAFRFVRRAGLAQQEENEQLATAMASPNFGTPPAGQVLPGQVLPGQGPAGPSPYASGFAPQGQPESPALPPRPEADPA